MPQWVAIALTLLLVVGIGAAWRFAKRTAARVADVAMDDRLASSRSARGGHGLQVHVEADPANMNLHDFFSTYTYLLPANASLDDVPADDVDQWWTWSRSLGGVPVGHVRVVVTIQLLVDRAVVVDEPRVVRRRVTGPKGVLVMPSPMGGDGFWPRVYRFDLDSETSRPTALAEALEHAPTGYQLTRDGTERIDILCATESGSWEWTVIIPVIIDGKRHELTIDDHGEPFRVVSAAGATRRLMWSPMDRRWEKIRR